MSIVWEWTDDAIKGLEFLPREKCALSGERLKPPFLLWLGPEVLAINASAFAAEEGTATPIERGYGLLMDLVLLLHIASKQAGGTSIDIIRAMTIRRLLPEDPAGGE